MSAKRWILTAMAVTLPLIPACKRAESAAGVGGPSGAAASVPVAPPGAAATSPAPAISAGTWTIDPVHSNLLFKAGHFGVGYIYGWFTDFSGTVRLDAEDPGRTSLEFTVQTRSLQTRDTRRDEHITGPDFLNAVQFPTMTFRSRSVAREADGTWTIDGELTIRGTTKPLHFSARPIGEGDDPMGKHRAGFEAAFTVNRMDFGASYMPDGIAADVVVILAAEAIKG